MSICKYSFNGTAWREELLKAYSFRFVETPDFKIDGDHITTAINPAHKEGFDNISLLAKRTYTAGVKASLRCSFDDIGCPEIIIVRNPELCDDGYTRYGDCFEIVLWKNGVNVWRHFMDSDYKCSWHNRLRRFDTISESDIHELSVEIQDKHICFSVDGALKTVLYIEDLFDEFYIGVTACEGVVRLYDFTIEEN